MNQQVLDMQSKAIEQVKAMQTQALELNERIVGLMPELPEMPAAISDRLAELPEPTDVVKNYFDFVAELQSANREFVQAMVAAWFPAEAPAKAKAAKSTKK